MRTHYIVNAHVLNEVDAGSTFVSYLACGALAYTSTGEQRSATALSQGVTCAGCRKVMLALASAKIVAAHVANGENRLDMEEIHSRENPR